MIIVCTASSDTYITDKIIDGNFRATDANAGQAATLDLFKLYNEKGFLEYSEFFKNAMEWFARNRMPVITDLPDTVEVTLTRSKDGAGIIHLINCSFDGTRPIKNIIPIKGKFIKVKSSRKYRRASDITTGRQLKMKKEGGYLKINLPELTGYNVIVLK